MSDSLQTNETIRKGLDLITHRTLRQQGRYVKAAGLSIQQFGILMQLHYQRKCGMSEISALMDISNAAASQLVEKLVQNSLLERAEDPNDRRAKQLKLTDKGKALVEASIAERHSWVDGVMVMLTTAEQKTVADAMGILTNALQRIREDEKSAAE